MAKSLKRVIMGEKNYSSGGIVAMITGSGFNLVDMPFQQGADFPATGRLTLTPGKTLPAKFMNGFKPEKPKKEEMKRYLVSAPVFVHENRHLCSHLPPY